ncbi:hypothetical protein [Allosphingosinicella vermicomposti]|uniref:hypothetical protein n=1 Tax=Allosphingosinicella vermicomposti TaxID=614671 RepID=UPI00131A5588|nr:hypothetical protein [Allosphingosinicella vermicomposti]
MACIRLGGLVAVVAVALSAPAMADTGERLTAPSAFPVIAAENAFARRHQEISVKETFLEYSAPDGIALTKEGVKNIKEFIGTWPDSADAGFIKWWPTMAGIAQSGDLGFTTGPASYGGDKAYSEYFTVWKKQPDGNWKWLLDQGTKPRKLASETTTDVFTVPVSKVKRMKAKKAWAMLQDEDKALSVLPVADAKAAAHYAPEVRLLGYQAPAVNGIEAARTVLAGRAADLKTEHQGGGVSAAGDLGYTYGTANWSDDKGTAKQGFYLRVWQRRENGWLILVENVSPF